MTTETAHVAETMVRPALPWTVLLMGPDHWLVRTESIQAANIGEAMDRARELAAETGCWAVLVGRQGPTGGYDVWGNYPPPKKVKSA